jgi:hypothetical protein
MQAGILHGVEAQLLNEMHHFLFVCCIVSGHRQGVIRRPSGPQQQRAVCRASTAGTMALVEGVAQQAPSWPPPLAFG